MLSRPIAERLQREKQRTEQILLAILPKDVVDELKTHGRVAPRGHESVTILFVDFVGFTRFAASSEPAVVVAELDRHFARFDAIAARYGLNAEARSAGRPVWPARIGLHTGPVISGVLGAGKLAFDIWGDAVNVAARMESASEAGFINLSETTAREVEPFFLLQDRGRISVKNRGRLSMFFLLGLRPELAGLEPGAPNELFRRRYDERLRWSTRTPSARPLPPSVEDGDGSVTPPAEAG